MREPLRIGTSVVLKNSFGEKEFVISKVVGMGHSCVVYDAYYKDELHLRHQVRLKELFPIISAAEAREQGSIVWLNEKDKDECRQSFENTYSVNLKIQENYLFTNTTCKINDALFEGNNTFYFSMEKDNGTTFSEIAHISAFQLFSYLKALCDVIGKFHDEGILYLDLKPENFLVLPETAELVKLFDFDSIAYEDEISSNAIETLSYSNLWAAPEVKNGKIRRIGKTADIYSIGLIMFNAIFGRPRDVSDLTALGSYDFTACRILDGVNPAVRFRLNIFLKKALNPVIKNRYQSMWETAAALDELKQLANPKRTYICDSIPKQVNSFSGRQEELETIDGLLQKNNLVVLYGIGGIGKTELALHYIQTHKNDYETISYVLLHDSVKKELESPENITLSSIDGRVEFNEKLRILKACVSKDTLFVLDNVQDLKEQAFLDIINLPAKFIVITRQFPGNIFSNMGVLELGAVSDEEALVIFRENYQKYVFVDDKNSIIEILHSVDNYTLLIPIIAKLMTLEDIEPREMLSNLQKQGIRQKTGSVVHYKDGSVLQNSMLGHVKALFDLSNLSVAETQALATAALLKGKAAEKRLLAAWSNPKQITVYRENDSWTYFPTILHSDYTENICGQVDPGPINALIEKGFLNFRQETGEVGIHDVIAEVVLSEQAYDVGSIPFLSEVTRISEALGEWHNEEYIFEKRDDGEYSQQDGIIHFVPEAIIYQYYSVVYDALTVLSKQGSMCQSFVIDSIYRMKGFNPLGEAGLLKLIAAEDVAKEDMPKYLIIKANAAFDDYLVHYYDKEVDDRAKRERPGILAEALSQAEVFATMKVETGEWPAEKIVDFLLEVTDHAYGMQIAYDFPLFDNDPAMLGYKKLCKILDVAEKYAFDKSLQDKIVICKEILAQGLQDYNGTSGESSDPTILHLDKETDEGTAEFQDYISRMESCKDNLDELFPLWLDFKESDAYEDLEIGERLKIKRRYDLNSVDDAFLPIRLDWLFPNGSAAFFSNIDSFITNRDLRTYWSLIAKSHKNSFLYKDSPIIGIGYWYYAINWQILDDAFSSKYPLLTLLYIDSVIGTGVSGDGGVAEIVIEEDMIDEDAELDTINQMLHVGLKICEKVGEGTLLKRFYWLRQKINHVGFSVETFHIEEPTDIYQHFVRLLEDYSKISSKEEIQELKDKLKAQNNIPEFKLLSYALDEPVGYKDICNDFSFLKGDIVDKKRYERTQQKLQHPRGVLDQIMLLGDLIVQSNTMNDGLLDKWCDQYLSLMPHCIGMDNDVIYLPFYEVVPNYLIANGQSEGGTRIYKKISDLWLKDGFLSCNIRQLKKWVALWERVFVGAGDTRKQKELEGLCRKYDGQQLYDSSLAPTIHFTFSD